MSLFNTDAKSATGRKLFKEKAKKTELQVRKPVPDIQFGEHGRYQIKSGRLSGAYVARAFPKQNSKARGLIAEATGDTEEEAIAALHTMIDDRDTRRVASRRKASGSHPAIPTADEFFEAISQIPLTRPQRAMLQALSLAGDDGLSEQQMSNAAGYKSLASASRAFSAAGQLIASYLAMPEPEDTASPVAGGPSCLGWRAETHGDAHPGNWILHQEVRDALRAAL